MLVLASLLSAFDMMRLPYSYFVTTSVVAVGLGQLADNYDVEPVALGKGGFAVGR